MFSKQQLLSPTCAPCPELSGHAWQPLPPIPGREPQGLTQMWRLNWFS